MLRDGAWVLLVMAVGLLTVAVSLARARRRRR
jgi:hypothetical protein